MNRFAGVLFAVAVSVIASAHVGSPNMVFDGNAGPYPVRVIVRPPDVVPGLAEVIVRVDASDVQSVGIRPVFWRAGVIGAPKPDEIERVPGSTNTYSGHTWLMSRGSYSVYVTVSGPRGAGTAIVPVNAFATGRLALPPALAGILVVLGALLVAGLITIIRAAAGESLVPPGETLSPTARRRANIVTVVAVPVLAVLIFGGAKWWESVDSDYQKTMYRPPAADATIDVDSTHRTLHLRVHDTAAFHAIFAPVVPDHGKMMHLFLLSKSGMQSFTHLHPVEESPLHFVAELPWVVAGTYLMFADIVLENGTSLTVSNTLEIPAAPGSVTPSDPDDSWDRTAKVTLAFPNAERSIGEGYSMVWTDSVPLQVGNAIDLRFVVRDSAGKVAMLNPYLGMAAHAVVIRSDASVFVHLHPMGTVATAAQDAFTLRDRGDTTARGRLKLDALDSTAMPAMTMSGALSFPYEFPKPGRYRIWVQVKPKAAVLTGMFDVDVR
ncbi:MAG: hypothetical protein ABI442_10545 [Gemmatimonadaceae bacterium]